MYLLITYLVRNGFFFRQTIWQALYITRNNCKEKEKKKSSLVQNLQKKKNTVVV